MAGEVEAFFSYSRSDSEFVDRLDADLRARDFKTWVDRRKLEGGQNWQQEIERAIERFESLCYCDVSDRRYISLRAR